MKPVLNYNYYKPNRYPSVKISSQLVKKENVHPLLIESLYVKQCYLFDDEKSFPDVKIILQGLQKPLQLHRVVLTYASQMLLNLFKSNRILQNKKEEDAWPLDITFNKSKDNMYSNVLLKWLRSCYGDDMNLSYKELCAALTGLFNLQLTHQDELQKLIEDHMKKVAETDIKAGIAILNGCVNYEECHSDDKSRIDKEIAKRIFTLSNMKKYKDLVINCLLSLPSCYNYLDCIEYGEAHTEFSEFKIKQKYLLHHKDDMPLIDRRNILSKIKFSQLNGAEMKEVQALRILSKDQLIAAYQILVSTLEEKLIN